MGSVGIGSCDIIDIRQGDLDFDLAGEIQACLNPSEGHERQLPTLLLYDEEGLKIFEEITYLDEYYLTDAEIKLLEQYAHSIASLIPNGSQLIELGSGNLRKVNILLKALDELGKNVDYYALDLSKPELERTLNAVPPGTFKHVRCHGLWGTYDNGLHWLKQTENSSATRVIMTLGSSIGNFTRQSAQSFLRSFSDALNPSDIVIVGLDGCNVVAKIHSAYNDRKGTTERFYRNGLRHANQVLGYELFKDEEWKIVGQVNEKNGLHEAFVSPIRDIDTEPYHFKSGELIRFENAFKYSIRQQKDLWDAAGLDLRASYTNDESYHALNVLSPKAMQFGFQPDLYAKAPIPSQEEFKEIWKLWDLVSLKMLPTKELLSKPIYLRNCCIFYLGHIPAFLDIQLTKATDGKPTEPDHFQPMFERGIDPDVDNPEKCHAHSEVPDHWPALEEILKYQQDVRQRAINLLQDEAALQKEAVGKALWLAYEHEAMHLETYLYMLLQSDQIIPPPGARPDFQLLASRSYANGIKNSWLTIPSGQVTIGQAKSSKYWTWDNEKPDRVLHVNTFQARSLPITNGDYVSFLLSSNASRLPATWTTLEEPGVDDNKLLNGHANTQFADFIKNKAVRTVYGPVPLLHALDWPAMGSFDDLSACAEFLGGRIPTLEESKSIHARAEVIKPDSMKKRLNSEPDLFVDLTGSNVGMKNFHPVPVTAEKELGIELAPMGGAWEWTSSVLQKWEDFEPMPEYPGYTSLYTPLDTRLGLTMADDFFDDKHNIVLGGSWATLPRIAGRRSFVNWYQRNYPYAWTGARLVRDLPAGSSVNGTA